MQSNCVRTMTLLSSVASKRVTIVDLEQHPHRAFAPPTRRSFWTLVRDFVRWFSIRQLVVIELEDWLGSLSRIVPGTLGLLVRYVVYKTLCGKVEGFCVIYTGAWLTHTYGIRLGRNFHMDANAYVNGRGGVTIGENVILGVGALVFSAERNWVDPNVPMIFQGQRAGPVTIGDDVWLGAHSVVTPGVRIATGTVVGANAVVTHDTEPYAIVAGVPARKIGERARPTV